MKSLIATLLAGVVLFAPAAHADPVTALDDLSSYLNHAHTETLFKQMYAENLDAAMTLGFKPVSVCFDNQCSISVLLESKEMMIQIIDFVFHEGSREEREICIAYKHDLSSNYCAYSDGRIVHKKMNKKTKVYDIEATVETEFEKEGEDDNSQSRAQWQKKFHDDKATYYVDKASGKSSSDGNVRYETLLIDYDDDKPNTPRQVWSSVMTTRFNCQQKVVNIADVTYFDAALGSGKVVSRDTTKETDWIDVTPELPPEVRLSYQFACKGGDLGPLTKKD
jgi:hypothetical protein